MGSAGQCVGHAFALGNVANVALNYVASTFPIDITDELDGNVTAVFMLQRQILVANTADPLQGPHCLLGNFGILEKADLPQLLSQEVLLRMTQQCNQKRIDIHHPASHRIQDQDAVMRRLEKTSVADFRNLQVVFRFPSVTYVRKKQHEPGKTPTSVQDWT